MGTIRSLDYLAAKTAQEIVTIAKENDNSPSIGISAKDLENLVTKALGVLQAQGVYAMFLFLYSKSGEKKPEQQAAAFLVAKLWNALKEKPAEQLGIYNKAGVNLQQGGSDLWEKALEKRDDLLRAVVEHLTAHLDTLLLVRDLYEQTLIYARYHAKALSNTAQREKTP